MSTSHSSAPICIHCAPSGEVMIIPFSDFATRSLRRRTGVIGLLRDAGRGVHGMRVPSWCRFLFYFYRKMSLSPSTLMLLLLPGTAWSSTTQALPNCSLAWLNIKSHLNGWMISTIRQHFEGILVLFHSGSGQEEVTREMMHWHCTYYQCGVGLPACVLR